MGHWRYIMVYESTRGIAIHKLASYQKPREPLCNEEAGNKEHHLAMQQPNSKFILQCNYKEIYEKRFTLTIDDSNRKWHFLERTSCSQIRNCRWLINLLVKWGHPFGGRKVIHWYLTLRRQLNFMSCDSEVCLSAF